jgi:hypothetical protein
VRANDAPIDVVVLPAAAADDSGALRDEYRGSGPHHPAGAPATRYHAPQEVSKYHHAANVIEVRRHQPLTTQSLLSQYVNWIGALLHGATGTRTSSVTHPYADLRSALRDIQADRTQPCYSAVMSACHSACARRPATRWVKQSHRRFCRVRHQRAGLLAPASCSYSSPARVIPSPSGLHPVRRRSTVGNLRYMIAVLTLAIGEAALLPELTGAGDLQLTVRSSRSCVPRGSAPGAITSSVTCIA